MGILYNIVTIENYADDAATEAALNAQGADDWGLVLANSKPNPQTGKPNSTIIFKKTVVTSSSSSSTSVSLSSSSRSISISSSSNSDAAFMGTGWPYNPDYIEVTIGNRWIFNNVNFVEDEVMTLKRVGEEGGSIVYTESGESVASFETNRIKFKIKPAGGSKLWVYWSPMQGGIYWTVAAYAPVYGTPYDFKAFWDTNPSFNTYADSDYFDVSQSTSFSTYLYYQGEIFKTMTFVEFSSSSVSASSSSTSLAIGGFDLIDQVGVGESYQGVWADGNFVYAAIGSDGIRSHSVDPSGFLTTVDTNNQGGYNRGVWGDGNFLYAANGGDGLRSYSVDSTGGLTYIDVDDQGGGSYFAVWGDGTFIYVACDDDGLRTYSVDSTGGLTYIDVDDQGGHYRGVWGDGTYIYAVGGSDGLRSYSVDGGGNLNHIHTDDQGGFYESVWGDGTFVYAACGNNGLRTYSVDGGGNLNFIDVDFQGGHYSGVWGDGTYIYVSSSFGVGITSYTVDGGGLLTFVASDYIGWGAYNEVWGDGNYIYIAATAAAVLSYRVRT